MKTNYEKKLFIARVMLALALLVGVLSAFQCWELVSINDAPTKVHFRTMVSLFIYCLDAECSLPFSPLFNIKYYLITRDPSKEAGLNL